MGKSIFKKYAEEIEGDLEDEVEGDYEIDNLSKAEEELFYKINKITDSAQKIIRDAISKVAEEMKAISQEYKVEASDLLSFVVDDFDSLDSDINQFDIDQMVQFYIINSIWSYDYLKTKKQ